MIKNRYVLEDSIDHVPFGLAYRAIDTLQAADARERHVSLWVLPAHVGKSVAPDALRHEFARLRAVRHPNIARLLELDHADGSYFMTSEDLDGETLRNVLDHLRPERLDAEEAASAVSAIGSALAHAHDHDVVHGEVRPENVVVTMDHEFKLVNFMASALARLSPTAARTGDDVRDLAVLAHELYTGERLGAHGRAQGKAPRRVARAIDAALHAGRNAITVREFLATAGLATTDATETTYAPAPAAAARVATPEIAQPRPPLAPSAPAPQPVLAAAPAPQLAAELRARPADARRPEPTPPRRSFWRFAVPFMALAALAVGLYQAGGVGALADAGRQLQVAGDSLLGRVASRPRSAAAGALDGPVATPVEATVAPAIVETASAAPAATDAAPPADDRPVLSFAAAKVTARESQSMIVLDIVRTGGDGPASVVWWTTEGTAHARDDFASFGRRGENFAAADNGRRIFIPIVSDSVRESAEHFQVHLAARSDATRIGAIDTVDITLLDDDDS